MNSASSRQARTDALLSKIMLIFRKREKMIMKIQDKKIISKRKNRNRIIKKLELDESQATLLISQYVLEKDWDNEYDECWNKY